MGLLPGISLNSVQHGPWWDDLLLPANRRALVLVGAPKQEQLTLFGKTHPIPSTAVCAMRSCLVSSDAAAA